MKKEKITTEQSTTIQGKNYKYRLTQSPRARGVRLKISMGSGLEVIVPYRHGTRGLDHLFAHHENWIIKQMAKMEQRKKHHEENQLKDGSIIKIFDEPHSVKILPLPQKHSSARKHRNPHVKRVQKLIFTEMDAIVDGHELHVYIDGEARPEAPEIITKAQKTLEKYLREVAEKYFTIRTTEIANRMGVTFKNITIRGQKTRWGSCSRQKNLNFNWRLILLPVPVAESVIIHELAHTVHMNHSKAFYAYVEQFCPDYRKLQKHLRNTHFPV